MAATAGAMGYIIHLGVVLMSFGIIALSSSRPKHRHHPQRQIQLGDYTLTFKSLAIFDKEDGAMWHGL